jgi:dolichol-phosphate mannosyltransferase
MNPQSVSVIVPTYREAENVPVLVGRLRAVAREHHLELEILLMDDRSDDGIAQVVSALGERGLKLVVRDGERSLSCAVLDGLRLARHDVLVVMDADLSHPPEAIPRLLETLARPGVDFVLGSRYVEGATIDESWGALRRLNSFVARWLARPLTNVRDPSSGFFALRRQTFLAADDFDPIGYKIGLELIVKCHSIGIREVPIDFAPRLHGTSKLDLRERIDYLRHIKRLVGFRFGDVRRRGKTHGRRSGEQSTTKVQ